jgi:ABC-type branched-subunit amino acid transport system permease subunit
VFSGRLALRGVYFAVVTLALSYLSEKLADAGGQITGGQNGILQRVKLGLPWFAFNKGYGFYAFAALLLVAAYLFLRWYVASPAGLVLRGIRENEDRVALLGYDVARVKRRVFVMSGAIAGFAGAIFHVHDTIVSPSAVGVQASTLALLWVALGGRGTLLGPIAGAVGLSYLTATLSSGDLPRYFLDFWLLLVGAILVAVIMVFPAGLFGYLSKRRLAPPTEHEAKVEAAVR